MTAKEAITPLKMSVSVGAQDVVAPEMPLIEVLPRLLESGGRCLAVVRDGETIGYIDQTSMLEALGRQIAVRDDSSVITVNCAPGEYSASALARAVEDADVHLVDLLTVPVSGGRLDVTLRVRCADPAPVVHSLERYGFEVTEISGGHAGVDLSVAYERLLELQTLINV